MPDVWGYLVTKYEIGRVLDIGCGHGHTCKWFQDLGLTAQGIDGDPRCLAAPAAPGLTLHQHDFTQGPFQPGPPFDLAWSAEFLEHVAEEFLPNLKVCFQSCRLAVVTHAEPHQGGHHHVNCQTDAYWERVFWDWGFRHVHKETARLRRTDRQSAPWGRRSLMFFERL